MKTRCKCWPTKCKSTPINNKYNAKAMQIVAKHVRKLKRNTKTGQFMGPRFMNWPVQINSSWDHRLSFGKFRRSSRGEFVFTNKETNNILSVLFVRHRGGCGVILIACSHMWLWRKTQNICHPNTIKQHASIGFIPCVNGWKGRTKFLKRNNFNIQRPVFREIN